MQWTIPKGPFACSYVDTSVILLDTRKPYNILALKLIFQQRRKSTDKLFTNWKWKFGLALVSRRLSFCCEQRDFTSISNCLCLPGERASIMYALCSAVNIKTKCFHKKLLSTLSRKSKNWAQFAFLSTLWQCLVVTSINTIIINLKEYGIHIMDAPDGDVFSEVRRLRRFSADNQFYFQGKPESLNHNGTNRSHREATKK